MNNYPDWLKTTLGPQHFWGMQNSTDDDGDSDKNRPLGYDTDNDVYAFVGTTICEDTTHSMEITAGNKCEIQDVSDINMSSLPIRQIGGWFQCTDLVKCPTSIYKEGGGANNVALLIGFGNIPEAQVADAGDFYVQRVRYAPLKPNKPYHIFAQFSGTDYDGDYKLYINGRLVETKIVGDEIAKTTLASHGGDVVFGKTDTSLNMGSVSVSFGLDQTQRYSCWLSESSTLYSEETIWQIFEYGAVPVHTISSQDDLDGLGALTFDDDALAIRIDSADDVTIRLDNVSFDEWTSIQVQYVGTGICTLRYTPNCNLDPDRCTSPNGGTINIQRVVPIKITALDIKTKNPIQGARVFLEEDSSGDVLINDVTDSNGQIAIDYIYSDDTEISGKIRKASSPPYYKGAEFTGTITKLGFNQIVFMVEDK